MYGWFFPLETFNIDPSVVVQENMAALRAIVGLSVVAVLVHTATGATHAVGGSNGWGLGSDFGSWAASVKFETGDSLAFSYGTFHSVVEVSKADYDSCSASSALSTAADGNTAVKLSSPGKRYFICGTPGHCSAGMKVEIDTVVAAAAAATPPPAASPPVVTTPPPPPSPSPKHRSPAPAEPPTPPEAPASSLSPSGDQTAAAAPTAAAPAVEPARPKASVLAATAAPTPQASAAVAFGRTSTRVAMGVAVSILMALLAI